MKMKKTRTLLFVILMVITCANLYYANYARCHTTRLDTASGKRDTTLDKKDTASGKKDTAEKLDTASKEIDTAPEKVHGFKDHLPDSMSCIIHKQPINRYNIYKKGCSEVSSDENYVCTKYLAGFKETGKYSQLCVYNNRDIVSKAVRKHQIWEKKFMETLEYFLKHFPNSILLDLGCNVGTFTVWAAAVGAPVVGIDINELNLRLIAKSLRLNEMQENVTLLWNAVSDKHETISMVRHEYNVGSYKVGQGGKGATIAALTMDDLVPLFKDKTVFIKMDVEGSEWKALHGGRKFFKSVKVSGLIMEYVYHAKKNSGKQIREFMHNFGFEGHHTYYFSSMKFDIHNETTFHNDVLFLPKKFSDELLRKNAKSKPRK